MRYGHASGRRWYRNFAAPQARGAGMECSSLCRGWDVRIDLYRYFETHRLWQLANLVVAFLEIKRARKLLLAGGQLLFKQDISRSPEFSFIYRQRFPQQFEFDRLGLGELQCLACHQTVVEFHR